LAKSNTQQRSISKTDKFSLRATAANKSYPNSREIKKLTFLLNGERNLKSSLSMILLTPTTLWLLAMLEHPLRRRELLNIR